MNLKLSLYGIFQSFLDIVYIVKGFGDERILITRPQLIDMPSLARSPVAPVRFSRSDPARSTKWNLAESISNSVIASVLSLSFPSSSRF